MTTPEEKEVLEDEQGAQAVDRENNVVADAEPVPDDKKEYIEFVGQPPYGTEFYNGEYGTHTVFANDFKKYHDLDLGKKEVVWRKGPNGRMLVPVADITPEAAEYLASDPMFKRVTL